jgi:hypothetical protein
MLWRLIAMIWWLKSGTLDLKSLRSPLRWMTGNKVVVHKSCPGSRAVLTA